MSGDRGFAFLFAGNAVCQLGDQANSQQCSVRDKYNDTAEEIR